MPQRVNIQGVGTVNFPDDFTPEQIQSAIETDILPQVGAQPRAAAPVAPPVQREAPTALERFGRGMADVGDRAAQVWMNVGAKLGLPGYGPGMAVAGQQAPTLADIGTQQMNAENADYEAGRAAGAPDGKPGIDWWRMGGNAVATAPLAAVGGTPAGLIGKVGVGMLQGGLAGAAQYDPTNSLAGTAKNTAIGAGTGAVMAPITHYVGKGLSWATQKIVDRVRGAIATMGGDASEAAISQAVPELAGLAPDVRADLITEAQAQIRQTGDLNAEAIGRKANLLVNGLTPTKAMVTRNAGDWTMERNLQKLVGSPDSDLATVGQNLTGVFDANDAAVASRLQGFSGGLPQATQEAHGQAVMASLDKLSDASQAEVGKVYAAVRSAKGNDLASDARNLVGTLDDLKDNTYAEKLVSSVTNRLKRFGMIDSDGNPTTNTLTIDQAEELRKFVNKLPNDFGKRDIIKAIDADVLSGAGQDAFSGARAAAADRFSMLENPATQRALNAYGELQQGKTAQNFIRSQIVNGADQDVRSLVDTISRMPQQQADETMRSMRAGLLQHIQDEATNPNSGQVSGAALNKTLRQLGDTKLVTVLGPQQTQQLKSLARAALDAGYAPTHSAVNHSNTATALLSLTRRARMIPGMPMIVTDEAQKAAERAAARSQLAQILAARSRQPGSFDPTVLAQVLQRYSPAVSGAAINQARAAQQ